MIVCAVPKASPDPLPELDAYLAPFAPLFRRAQTRQSLERYVTGLLTDLAHKTADTIAAAVAGTTSEGLQHLLTDADWHPAALDEQRNGEWCCGREMSQSRSSSGGLSQQTC